MGVRRRRRRQRPSSVVEAIAAGERAAVGMDQYLTGADHAIWREKRTVDTFFDPDADPVIADRPDLKLLPVAQRAGSFVEVETTWSRAVALGRNQALSALRLPGERRRGLPDRESLKGARYHAIVDDRQHKDPGARRHQPAGSGAPGRDQDPVPLLPQERAGHRLLPGVPGGGEGRQDAPPLLRDACLRGDGGEDQLRPGARRAPHRRGADPLRPRRGLPDLRPFRGLRASADRQ